MDFYRTHAEKTEKKLHKDLSPAKSSRNAARQAHTQSAATKHGAHHHESIRIIAQRMLGNFLILFSLYMLSWVFYTPMLEEIKYAYNQFRGVQYVVQDSLDTNSENGTDSEDGPSFRTPSRDRQKGLLSDVLGNQTIQPLVPKDPDFSVVIPKLGANENVIPQVNSANEKDYLAALEQGVAHAAGTALPGENQHVYLFAHSTNTFSNVSRYNAIFYLLYKLENGDEVNIYHKGVRHRYAVTGKTIVDPSEIQYLTRKTDTEFVTLQTCWPPGTVAQRMLVFAEPVAE